MCAQFSCAFLVETKNSAGMKEVDIFSRRESLHGYLASQVCYDKEAIQIIFVTKSRDTNVNTLYYSTRIVLDDLVLTCKVALRALSKSDMDLNNFPVLMSYSPDTQKVDTLMGSDTGYLGEHHAFDTLALQKIYDRKGA